MAASKPATTELRLITTDQPEHIYSLQAQLLNEIPLAKGDTMLIRFAARSLQSAKISGVTKLTVGMGKASPDWDASFKGEINLGAAWERYDFPFTCQNDFAPYEAQITFTFGYPAQQAEIADVQVLRFGPEVTLASLPKTKRSTDKTGARNRSTRPSWRASPLSKNRSRSRQRPGARQRHDNYRRQNRQRERQRLERRKPFATIPQALAVVKPGDTIQVGGGRIHRTQRRFG